MTKSHAAGFERTLGVSGGAALSNQYAIYIGTRRERGFAAAELTTVHRKQRCGSLPFSLMSHDIPIIPYIPS